MRDADVTGVQTCALPIYLALPFLLLESHGMSPIEAGLLITAWPLATVLTAPIAGRLIGRYADGLLGGIGMAMFALDRKSTRLNSSHVRISYAVFCLEKKK